MYKKSNEFFGTELAKRVSGLPQTDALVQQRRKAAPDAPIVQLTGTCVYCGTSPAGREQVTQLRTRVRKMTLELTTLRDEKKAFDSRFGKLERKHLKLVDFINDLPPRFRPKPPKRKRRKR